MKHVWVGVFAVLLATGAFAAGIADDLLTPYYVIRESYAKDSTAGVPQAADTLFTAADAYLRSPGRNAQFVPHLQSIRDGAKQLKSADLKAGRETFKSLSRSMAHLQRLAGNRKPVVFYCPMAKAYWLQENADMSNPYYGKEMLRCGEKVDPSAVK